MAVGFSEGAPDAFYFAEGGILLILGTFLGDFSNVPKFFSRWFPRLGAAFARATVAWARSGPRYAFALAFVLQYVALTPLLKLTGGPIDSPFAQLVVAFAVFVPILASGSFTIGFSVLWSVGYYATFVATSGFDSADAARPSPWVFFAVTVLILFVTVGVTVLDRKDTDRQYMEYLSVGGGNGQGEGDAAKDDETPSRPDALT